MQPYLKFPTQTAGEAARRALLSHGIQAVLRRNTQSGKSEGCSFALFVRGDLHNAIRVLKSAGIHSFRTQGQRDAP